MPLTPADPTNQGPDSTDLPVGKQPNPGQDNSNGQGNSEERRQKELSAQISQQT